ncbi:MULTISPECIES: serine O-acetyltransferase EpsC [Sphingobium]|uniref:serine O-acetyltransferase EpsC n=1 Tax=Sphingobium TaxID=165695 RepID=UPI001BE8A55D|nr:MULTISPECIES: serine O-acetyltransferase EpsC [Sphingobium]MBT2245963.1 serine acetyltransferase [Sphingobium sp. BHU LFT2]WBQ19217.1 serine O-acetyltransferase [Sphingobium yanoikuyae]
MSPAPNSDPLIEIIRFPEQVDLVVEGLHQARLDWRAGHQRQAEQGVYFPSRQALQRVSRELAIALFPLRFGPPELTAQNENAYVGAALESTLSQLAAQIRLERGYHEPDSDQSAIATQVEEIIGRFAAYLPTLRRLLDSDVDAGYAADPAARSVDEVLLAYPSLTAVIHHRIAHSLYRLGAPLVARVVAEIAHEKTGIDIHPGARIGSSFFIDHGTGVVIGETAILGDRVRLYQGVTLGGDPDIPGGQAQHAVARHPLIGDDVIIYANASIIGRVSIGAGSRIGGNVWLRQDVPPGSLVEAPAPTIRPI